MFEQKQQDLMSPKKNKFLEKASHRTESENGSVKYDTSGNDFVDQFAAIGTYKAPRSYAEVDKDMQALWDLDPKMCVQLALYIRTITRKPKIVAPAELNKVETLDIQKGQGLKHEGMLRFLWLAINHPKTFKNNIHLFIAAGSWKDIIMMLSYDLQYNGWKDRKLDWKFFELLLKAGVINEETTHLVRKYLPTIRTNKKCTTVEAQADTIIGRWFARSLQPLLPKEISYKEYRLLKSKGQAHQWQRLISQELYDQLQFNKIAGRALAQLVGSKFLVNHNLENKYREWISKQKKVNFTGYGFELFKSLHNGTEDYVKQTIDAQFNKLLEGTNVNSNLIVAVDVSGSMTSNAYGCNDSSYNIAKAMALYFSYTLKGTFENHYIEFSDDTKMVKWEGSTPSEKWLSRLGELCYGSTNFQGIIDIFTGLKKEGVKEEDFPKGILAISDGEFNNCGDTSNFNLALKKLRDAGFSDEFVDNFKIILWDIPNTFYNRKPEIKFEDFADAPNFFYLSGYDGSVISFLLEGKEIPPHDARTLMLAALNQDLLNRVKIVG